MTAKELLARAKDLGISGRHNLNKDELETAVRQREMIAKTKPQRRLVKNTNVPWRRKFYFIDVDRYEEMQEHVKKSPTQVQLILKSMLVEGTASPDTAEQGLTICSSAIKNGLRTKIEPHVLFAYYRKEMENLGLVFAGYNLDK